MKNIQAIEKYTLLLAPAFGLGAVIIYQFGRYYALGVPYELLELNPVNTFLAALSIAIFCLVSVVSLVTLFQREDLQATKYLPLYHVLVATVITFPFWAEEIGLKSRINWSVIFYILFASAVTYNTQKSVKELLTHTDIEKTKSDKAYGLFADVFWLLLLISLSLVTLGSHREKEPRPRTFLVGTNYLLVGTYNGLLIFKPLNETGASGNKKVVLMSADNRIELEERSNVALGR